MCHPEAVVISFELPLYYATVMRQSMDGCLATPFVDEFLEAPAWQIQQNRRVQRPSLLNTQWVLRT